MARVRGLAVAAAALMAAGALTGCVRDACPAWVWFDTPADARDAADAVAVGRVIERAGATPMFGTWANVWAVEVESWMEGDGPERIDVVSLPQGCEGPAYFGTDPFETATEFDQAIIFLSDGSNGWQSINPGQGVVESGDGGTLPDAWTQRSH
jgi:hypothetical protein